LAQQTAAWTTTTITEMDRRHDWFRAMSPEHRSWITLVARSGIDHFVVWVADTEEEAPDPAALFNAAPRQAMRRISLWQTVELLKTTIDVVEAALYDWASPDRELLALAIVYFSREVAFAAAQVYAQAAELRGSWDARLEALVVDAVMRGEVDEDLISRAAALGWSVNSGGVVVAVGPLPDDLDLDLDRIHLKLARWGVSSIVSPQENRLVVIIGGALLTGTSAALECVAEVADCFGDGPLVTGPVTADLTSAHLSARSALAAQQAAGLRPEVDRPVAADDLLAERVLIGDPTAGPTLQQRAIEPLLAAGHDLVTTLAAFLEGGGSIEATARQLYVHTNTVRYRLRRIAEVTGLDPVHPADAFALQVAIKLSRSPVAEEVSALVLEESSKKTRLTS
jgi:hypothetical protein